VAAPAAAADETLGKTNKDLVAENTALKHSMQQLQQLLEQLVQEKAALEATVGTLAGG
jgi:cell division protein FtsB